MAKNIAKKKVTAEQYQNALEAYKTNEIAARQLAAKRDKEVAKIDDKYNPLFEEYMEQQTEHARIVQEYCDTHRETLFDGKQELKMNGISLIYRKGKVKVCLIDGHTEETALAGVKEFLPDYIRTVETIAKDKILTDKDTIDAEALDNAGLYLGQDETFSIKVAESVK